MATSYTRTQRLEMDACTGCRLCADVCPAVRATGNGRLSGIHRLRRLAGDLKSREGFLKFLHRRERLADADWSPFSDTVYQCTLCGNCQEVCPAGIGLKDLWLDLRGDLTERGTYPARMDKLRENLAESRNVFGEDQDERCEWVEDLDDPPDNAFCKERAEVVYFTGCVAAYYPLAQQIPKALAETLVAAEVDFTLLGGEEWCCGFPLLGAGLRSEAAEVIEHNVAAVEAVGAREIVFACPSCYMMWKEHYPKKFRLTHATQYLDRLLATNRLPLKKLDLTVTYHDPCDLGRGARVFEEPRRVIRALPGVRLVEMAESRESCQCCGGGGNLEMIDAELNGGIAKRKLDQVTATGAKAVVTACQQCVRTMTTSARRRQVPIQVLDISQLVRRALDV